jgi:hypothetical protein
LYKSFHIDTLKKAENKENGKRNPNKNKNNNNIKS